MSWKRYALTPEQQEKLFGERVVVKTAPPKRQPSGERRIYRRPVSVVEAKAIVEEVESYRKEGMTFPDACEKAGAAVGSYHRWRLLVKGVLKTAHLPVRSLKQITEIVRQYDELRAEGRTRDASCKLLGVSSTSIYSWRKEINEAQNSNSTRRPLLRGGSGRGKDKE